MHGLARLRSVSTDRKAYFPLLLVAIVFAIDLCLPLGVASAVPYIFAVLLAVNARSRRFAPALAVLCTVLTIAKVFLVPDRGSTELWKVLANRFLSLFAIWMTAFLGMKRRRSEEDRQHAEEQIRLHLADLAHMGRLKTAGQLAAGLAHELNQPLAAVSLQSEIATQLAQREGAPEALLTALREITEQSQRAGEILRMMRSLVQKSEPQRLPVDLNQIVREVERLIESQTQRAAVVVRLRLAEPSPLVLGDKIQLEQVLLNLLQNAIEAIEAAGPGSRLVEVETGRTGDNRVTVRVRDSGIGLAPTDAERMFERFFSTKQQGMGMGLAISRSIVEAHDGQLIATPGPDRGAIFAFTLPILRRT